MLASSSCRLPTSFPTINSARESSMNVPVTLVTVVRDFAMYARCIGENPSLEGTERIAIDNRQMNEGIPKCYNRFLESFDFSSPRWLVFCHEDFAVCEKLPPLLGELPTDSCYGPIGARRIRWLFYPLCRWQMAGQIEERNKNGDGSRRAGMPVEKGTVVDTFDCQCLIVHSTSLYTAGLRFDENLRFDLYVEDFCIQASQKGVLSRILPMACCHYSIHDSLPPSYTEAITYLNRKYKTCYAGINSWIGRNRISRHIRFRQQ